jgi:YbbR domain-containing protein
VGPSTEVSQVHEVVASVSLDPSGLDFHGEVQPTPIDVDGNELRRVDVEPRTVRVTVPVFSDRQTESLPIEPVVTGTPAVGYRIRSVEVQPAVVGVEGDADDVAGLLVANTQQLSVNGRTEDFTEDVELALPPGVRTLEVDTVRVTVRIAAVTETRTIGAGIRVSGAPAGSTVTLSSDRVLVALFGPVSAIESAASGALLGTVDVAGLGPGTHEVPVVVTAPPGLTVADVSPPTIRVTIAAASSATAAPTPTPAP